MTIDKLVERSDLFVYGLVKPALTVINFFTCNYHSEMPESTYKLLSQGTPVLFTGLHKSLWETIGVPYILSKEYDLPVPYIVMAHALVGGKMPHWFMVHLGADFTKRAGGRGNIDLTKERIQSRLKNRHSVVIFPGMEKGRQKNGVAKPYETTAFEALIQMGDTQWNVPFNVDYTRVNELRNLKEIDEFLDTEKHYMFKLMHIARWLFRNFGDIYVSFGEPIKVTNDMNRRELADYTREKSLDLVKILAPNVLSKAMLRLNFDSDGKFDQDELYTHIEDVKKEYVGYADKFRGFDMDTSPQKIVKISKLPLDIRWLPTHNIYYNYISHFPQK